MAYTTINKSTEHFNTLAYAGNDGTNRSITGVGFKPDFTWFKDRSNAFNHYLFDVTRDGKTYYISSNTSGSETADTTSLKSMDSDGFTVGASAGVNGNNNNYASWNWKASGSTTNDTTSGYLPNTQSVNDTAGFTVLKYTGNATNTATNCGLSTPLDVSITKRYDGTGDWFLWHRYNTGTTGRNYLVLNSTGASQNSATIFQNVAPSMDGSISAQFMGASSPINISGAAYISYGFSSRKGYSKFGSYVGNNNADGVFIYTGFKPAFVIIKRSSAGENWSLYDNRRSGYNPQSLMLRPNTSDAEGSYATSDSIDFVSNGFKIRTSGTALNDGTYIYMAFAEAPLVGTNNVPATAR
tara:strand:+ start:1399 stop:2460 length:1062 start_codon:yes stop_codon:yes gene_type:complete